MHVSPSSCLAAGAALASLAAAPAAHADFSAKTSLVVAPAAGGTPKTVATVANNAVFGSLPCWQTSSAPLVLVNRKGVSSYQAYGAAPLLKFARNPNLLAAAIAPGCQRTAEYGLTSKTNPNTVVTIRDATGSRVTQLRADASSRGIPKFAWSPDGAVFAVASAEPGQGSTIRVVDGTRGTLLRRVKTAKNVELTAQAFAPKGAALAYADGQKLKVLTVATGALRTVEAPGAVDMPAFSPDGTKVAVRLAKTGKIGLVEPETGASTPIDLRGVLPASLTWSPDGSRIAFGVLLGKRADRSAVRVLSVADGTSTLALPAAKTSDSVPTWKPDSSGFAVERTSFSK